jgi:hypothetical protein
VKTKISKRHLKESDAPLLPGTDQVAMCGEIVPGAGFPFMYDDSLTYHFAEFLCSLHICETCWKTELAIANVRKQWSDAAAPLGERYVYGLAAGQDEIDAEREHLLLIEAA